MQGKAILCKVMQGECEIKKSKLIQIKIQMAMWISN